MKRRAAGMLLGAALLACQAGAQLPLHPPEIRSLFPIGVSRGADAVVRVEGVNIGDATGVVVTGEGVRAEVLGPDGEPLSPGAPRAARLVNNTEVRVRLQADPRAVQGVRELRLYTPLGLTCRGLFLIGPEGPVVTESGSDDAVPLPVPGTADGRLDAPEDVDRYRFTAQAGEAVALYVQSQPVETRLDAQLAVRDSTGRVLAENDDFRGRDPALAFSAPAAGEYTVEIRDVDLGGGPFYGYRLVATRGPVIRTTYPLGVPAGMLADVSLFGLNLGGTGKTTDFYSVAFDTAQARVEVPAGAGGTRAFQVATPRGVTNPFSLQVLEFPDLREQEPNDEPAQAARMPVPGYAHGRIFGSPANPAGDSDHWRFAAQAGEKLRLSVIAMRAGSPLDAALVVRGADGKKLAASDDAGGSRDPSLEFTPPATGEYLAVLSEAAGGGGLDSVYMLRVEPVRPDAPGFTVSIYPCNPSVPRGGSVPVEVRVTRTGGFRGPLRFRLGPLPEGVAALIPPESAREERFYVALTARADAPYGFLPFTLSAEGEIDGKGMTSTASGRERVWKNAPLRAVETSLHQVAVCEPMDFTVRLDRDTLELKPGESRDVTVIIHKIRGYVRGIPVRAATVDYAGGALPAGLSVGRVTLPAEAAEVLVSVSAAPDTAPGEYTVFICGLSNPTTNDYILVAQLAPPLRVRVAR